MFLNQLVLKSCNKTKPNFLKISAYFQSISKRCLQMGQKVSIKGINIHYEKVGTGDHNLLLLPGALGSTRTDFSPQLNGLNRDKFTLIAWDPPGYGYSRPPDRDFNDFYKKDAEMAANLMKTLGFERYSLLGWSDGGITALIMAANQTSVQKLVVFGSNAYVSEEDRKLITKIKDLNNWSPKAKQAFIDLYGEQLFVQMWNSFIDHYCKYEDICKTQLKNITQKCLILHGDEDPLVAKEHPKYLIENIKNSTLYRFPKGKHNIHQRYAEEFNKIVEQFLLKD